ncbi:MAG: Uma2 family endonuclease [Saprospiraceae bacterium]
MEVTILEKSNYETEREKPMPSINHSIVQGNLVFYLKLAYRKKYRILPEINIDVIDKGRVPDIAICNVNVPFQPGEDSIKLNDIPYGVIEILSPKQSLSELVQKSVEYFAVGIKSYWLVLPDLRSIYIFDKPQNYQVFTWKDILKDELLAIEIDLKEIFK